MSEVNRCILFRDSIPIEETDELPDIVRKFELSEDTAYVALCISCGWFYSSIVNQLDAMRGAESVVKSHAELLKHSVLSYWEQRRKIS